MTQLYNFHSVFFNRMNSDSQILEFNLSTFLSVTQQKNEKTLAEVWFSSV